MLFFISPAYSVPAMMTIFLAKLTTIAVWERVPSLAGSE